MTEKHANHGTKQAGLEPQTSKKDNVVSILGFWILANIPQLYTLKMRNVPGEAGSKKSQWSDSKGKLWDVSSSCRMFTTVFFGFFYRMQLAHCTSYKGKTCPPVIWTLHNFAPTHSPKRKPRLVGFGECFCLHCRCELQAEHQCTTCRCLLMFVSQVSRRASEANAGQWLLPARHYEFRSHWYSVILGCRSSTGRAILSLGSSTLPISKFMTGCRIVGICRPAIWIWFAIAYM